MKAFATNADPNSTQQVKNIAGDPFSAAKFVHYNIKVVLEQLFGIMVKDNRITCKEGVLGIIEGYIGAVEAQGCGTLHLHKLLWLRGVPTAGEMKNLLQAELFKQQICNYIMSTVKA